MKLRAGLPDFIESWSQTFFVGRDEKLPRSVRGPRITELRPKLAQKILKNGPKTQKLGQIRHFLDFQILSQIWRQIGLKKFLASFLKSGSTQSQMSTLD